MKIRVVHKPSGQVWEDENTNHSFSELVLHMLRRYPKLCTDICYCDIEGIGKINEEWVLLDECGRYCFIPSDYIVDVI